MTKDEQNAKIEALLNAKHPVTIGSLAHELECTAQEAAHLLPSHMRTFAPGADFDKVWETIASWDSATVIISHMGNFFEIVGKIATGKHAHGYYNIMGGKSHLEGHIKADKVAEIGLITLPFMGRESHFVAFFDADGASMYDIYVGRENHQLIESAKESFLAMQAGYAGK
jgi:hypothetical protein